jgi:6-phosphogluconolactonase
MQLSIYKNVDEMSRQVADWLVGLVKTVLAKQDRFTIALSGGSTPKKLFKLLASDQYKNKIDWSKLHFFWGDERFVPFADERNNARMAYEELLDQVPVNKSQVHIMQTGLSPAEAVLDYDKILHRYFDGEDHTFDLVMLGLGDNAHTLSLFPGYEVVHEKKEWVSAFYLEEQEMYRITLTAPVVNKSAHIAYLVGGGDKASSVKEVIEGDANPDLYPAQVINPEQGELYWFLDEAAAADLS